MREYTLLSRVVTLTCAGAAHVQVAPARHDAFGPGLMFGLGADFWVDEHWAVGAMARFTAAALLEEEAGRDYVHGVIAPCC